MWIMLNIAEMAQWSLFLVFALKMEIVTGRHPSLPSATFAFDESRNGFAMADRHDASSISSPHVAHHLDFGPFS